MTWSARPARTVRRLLAGTAALTCCATLAAAPVAQASPGSAATRAAAATRASAAAAGLDPTSFKGVNWADPRDNYVDGPVVPTGLSTSDDYRTTYRKATAILSELVRIGRITTVRLPVNTYSVGTAWWGSYRAAVDAATDLHLKVILGYWEGTAHKDGLVDDPASWDTMWATLTGTYQRDAKVLFEPMNEPFGYTDTDLRSLEARWIADHPLIPRNRVVVSGTGYNDSTSTQCADPALAGTYVSQHFYGFWHQGPSYAQWRENLRERIAGCEGRLFVDEFGSPMTAGYDYTASATGTSDPERNEYVAYLQATTDLVRETGAGGVYWPGLRAADTYSLTTLDPVGRRISLSLNSTSGLRLLEWAWGRGTRPPHPAP